MEIVEKKETKQPKIFNDKCLSLFNDYYTFHLYVAAVKHRAQKFLNNIGIFTLDRINNVDVETFPLNATPNQTYDESDIEEKWENFGDPFLELLDIYYEQLDVIRDLYEESIKSFEPVVITYIINYSRLVQDRIETLTRCKKIIDSQMEDSQKIFELRKILKEWW